MSVYAPPLSGNASSAFVATGETTTSTTYADLTTTTDTVTIVVGTSGAVLVTASAQISNNTSGANVFMGFAISGASTVAATDSFALSYIPTNGTQAEIRSGAWTLTGLLVGSTTFKLKYRVASNTGTYTNRRIGAIPLG